MNPADRQTDLLSRPALWLEESSKVGTFIAEDEACFEGEPDKKQLESGKKVQISANKTYIKLGTWDQLML
jgi:hypothetical protein